MDGQYILGPVIHGEEAQCREGPCRRQCARLASRRLRACAKRPFGLQASHMLRVLLPLWSVLGEFIKNPADLDYMPE